MPEPTTLLVPGYLAPNNPNSMKLFNHIPTFLKNKYFISTAAFCVVMLFLDKNDLFTQLERRKELRHNEQSKAYYSKLIPAETKMSKALENNFPMLEKQAREKYYMKRDNEELFLIPEKYDADPSATKN